VASGFTLLFAQEIQVKLNRVIEKDVGKIPRLAISHVSRLVVG
jgi:hypothetical protein